MTRLNKFIIILIGLIVLNLGFLNYKEYQRNTIPPSVSPQVPVETKIEYIDQCGKDCQEYIDNKLTAVKVTPVPTSRVIAAPARTKVQSTQYFPISITGSTSSNDWVDVTGSDFYFNTGDYVGLKQIQFEATIRLLNGNGKVYVRLFDVTNGIAVQGSQSDADSQSATVVVASPTVFWSGRNLIRVQLKSLTADTAIFDSGRLKIITEN